MTKIYEDELIRVWKEDELIERENIENSSYFIEYRGLKLGLVGFTRVYDKNNNKVILLYKIKKDQSIILYYLPEPNNPLAQEILATLNEFAPLKDVCEFIPHIMDKIDL